MRRWPSMRVTGSTTTRACGGMAILRSVGKVGGDVLDQALDGLLPVGRGRTGLVVVAAAVAVGHPLRGARVAPLAHLDLEGAVAQRRGAFDQELAAAAAAAVVRPAVRLHFLEGGAARRAPR